MSIRTKFAVGLAAILVVNLGAGLYGLYHYKRAYERKAEVYEASTRIVAASLSAQVHFKKQVQEWKNVLLRGQDEALYARYLRQFEAEERRTREAIADLTRLLAGNEKAGAIAEDFLRAHFRLGRQYRAALAYYDPEASRPHLEVDRRVRGIDRKPTDLLDKVVEAASAHKDAQVERIEVSTRGFETRILLLVVGVMTGAVLVLIWLVDRTIGRPIATATAIARRVSAGDFSTPIMVAGRDDTAQMLGALKTMQESLAVSQESLRESEAHSRLLLESAGEGIYGVDSHGRCIFFNPVGAKILGFQGPEQLLGKDMHAIMHHAYPDGTPYPADKCRASRTYRNGEPAHVDDEVFWRADGSSVPVEYRSYPIYRNGRLAGAVVNFSDISERKRAESEIRTAHDALAEERARLADRVAERTAELDLANADLARIARAKDEFLAAMSHELRTPLTSILGLSETLEDGLLGALSERQAKAARTIRENGTHLLALINDILDLAKVESGKMEIVWDEVPAAQLWDASLRMIRQSAERKGLGISTNIDQAVRLLRGDSRRLKQMLVNLLGNAVKFTPSGGRIGLDVSADPDRHRVRIGVWDTGIGIPAEQRARLFEPFVQLDSRLSRQYDGSGLGLALLHSMVELHGGDISVESEVGQGSRFEVTLPWDPDAQDASPGEQEQALAVEEPGPDEGAKQVPVLLVEDNQDNREMLADYLRSKGYRVATAGNGSEALSAAWQSRPALILMDIQMPEMDGLEATRRLRADPVLRDIPIIALTALAMPGDKERCLEAGMDDYLSKPVGLKELLRVVSGWLTRTRAA
jgi:PAS domain S-box-containing protein